MKKREVTNEMVKRGAKALRGRKYTDEVESLARAVLDAALTPPAEPEIEVSEAMLGAGTMAYRARPGSPDLWDCLRDAYRAMERARRGELPKGEWAWCPDCKQSFSPASAHAHGQRVEKHRRKDDPG